MAQDAIRPIIVKRIKKVSGGHHGGAWKIAYADFVTAMMAFFLLMWLLGSTTKAQLQGISEYFQTPLKVALQGGHAVGSSKVILKGGGQDLTKQQGQVKRGDNEADKTLDVEENKPKIMNYEEAKAELLRQERARLEELKKKIEEAIDASEMLRQFKNQLLLDITSEGLRIQIVDERNRPMFALASAQLQPYARQILLEIGKMLNGVPNKISLSGHTDAAAYGRGEKGYSNWELSTDRANASRRELVAGGMDESKMLRVVGLSSAVLFDKKDPLNPINRRISIIIMNKQAEENAIKDDSPVEVPVDGDRSALEEVVSLKSDN
ncbi:MAG: flagellar motor protein MotB [Nitrosomonadales bacterium]|nr:flagellar motor protein MotB [Nitrosomonadales bacterium]